MAAATVYVFPIEQVYEPHELQTATAGRRLGAYALDILIQIFTLYIGWLIWFIFTAQKGQTPGKQLVHIYIIREDGTRAGGGYTWVREFLVKGLLFGLIGAFTGGIGSLLAMLWLLWDRDRQCLWDKITSTHVGYSPGRFVPQTAPEQHISGDIRTRTPGQQVTVPVTEAMRSTGASAGGTGAGAGMSSSAIADRLRELQQLREDGLITAEEYEERRIEAVKDL